MELKRLKKVQDGLVWPLKTKDLAVWTWDRCERPIFLLMCDTEPPVINTVKQESDTRTLVLISGFIHDTSSFVANHPGGKRLLESYSGKDATEAFFGGVYRHSNAAQNVCKKDLPCPRFFSLSPVYSGIDM